MVYAFALTERLSAVRCEQLLVNKQTLGCRKENKFSMEGFKTALRSVKMYSCGWKSIKGIALAFSLH
jgi:hypothetical protein